MAYHQTFIYPFKVAELRMRQIEMGSLSWFRWIPQVSFLSLKRLPLHTACFSHGNERIQEVGPEACTTPSLRPGTASPPPIFCWPKEVTWPSPTSIGCEGRICGKHFKFQWQITWIYHLIIGVSEELKTIILIIAYRKTSGHWET